MYYGRFSGVDIEDIEIQVAKTLVYEQYTFPNPSFLDEVVLVAGVDASMAPTYGNGQINYGTDYYLHEPGTILNGSGQPYQKFTPFYVSSLKNEITKPLSSRKLNAISKKIKITNQNKI